MAYKYIHPSEVLKKNKMKTIWSADNRRYTACAVSSDNAKFDRCCLCGQFILPEEDYFLCLTPLKISDPKKRHKPKFVVHADEWIDFSLGLTNEELIKKFLTLKTPKQSRFTSEQLDKIQDFKEACQMMGFTSVGYDPRGLRMSLDERYTLCYNVYYDHIHLEELLTNFRVITSYVSDVKKIIRMISYKREHCIL